LSKNKGFSETSAGRYSLALYELATEANNLSEIEVHSASIINLILQVKILNL
jgi:F-type H+-transporting ATPase subunit delta